MWHHAKHHRRRQCHSHQCKHHRFAHDAHYQAAAAAAKHFAGVDGAETLRHPRHEEVEVVDEGYQYHKHGEDYQCVCEALVGASVGTADFAVQMEVVKRHKNQLKFL